jgi:hypothetical protein
MTSSVTRTSVPGARSGTARWSVATRRPDWASTPLELLFDLSFVVAVAAAASGLHHDLAAGEIVHGTLTFLIVFFTIWWPWVNFTWFASAYDTDDVLYRLLTFVQIAGVLVVAAGVRSVFDGLDFRTAVFGYVIMRIALVAQWLRAAAEDPGGRAVALRFAVGITVVQLLWVVRLAIGQPWGYAAIIVLGLAELAIPVWAERSGRPTPWRGAHRRALRPVHDHRPRRRVRPGRDDGRQSAFDARRSVGRPGGCRARWADPRVRPVVGVLQNRSGIDEGAIARRAIAWATATTSSSPRSPRSARLRSRLMRSSTRARSDR